MDKEHIGKDCDFNYEENIFKDLQPVEELKLEPRPIYLKLSVVNSVKGSAYMEYGKTKVIVIIEPPRELTSQQKNIEVPCLVSCLTNIMPSSTDDPNCINNKQDMLSISLKKVLESSICRNKFLNFQLDIKVIVLEDDGCALSTAINCCGAALVVAGIPTYNIITASTICFYKEMEFVDPDRQTENFFSSINEKSKYCKDYGIVTTASFSSINQVTGCFQKGMLSRKSFARLFTHTLQINECINNTLKHIFLENVQKAISENESR